MRGTTHLADQSVFTIAFLNFATGTRKILESFTYSEQLTPVSSQASGYSINAVNEPKFTPLTP